MTYSTKMAQPMTLIARMNPNIAASRPHSRTVSAVRTECRRGPIVGMRTILPPRTAARWARQATGLVPGKGLDRCGTVPDSHRTSLASYHPRCPGVMGTVPTGPRHRQDSPDDQILIWGLLRPGP